MNFIIMYNRKRLYSMGYNTLGQLGTKNEYYQKLPCVVTENGSIRRISRGYNHSLIHMDDGRIIGFGDNRKGQLIDKGDKNSANVIYLPLLLPLGDDNLYIGCCDDQSYVLKKNGNLLALGSDCMLGEELFCGDKM